MAEADDPTEKYLAATQRYQSILHSLWKTTFKKIATYLKSVISFIDKVIAQATEIAAKIGKAAIDLIVKAGTAIKVGVNALIALIRGTLKFGEALLKHLRKGLDPKRLIPELKKRFARYMLKVKSIFDQVREFLSQMDILSTVLGTISQFKNILRLIISWIVEVTRANDAVMKVKRLLTKTLKAIRKEIKESVKLRKQVLQLKVPA